MGGRSLRDGRCPDRLIQNEKQARAPCAVDRSKIEGRPATIVMAGCPPFILKKTGLTGFRD